MGKTRVLIPAALVVLLALTAAAVYLSTAPFDTTLEFQVRDRVSKQWVWDATMRLQKRVIRGFYQSDRGPITYRFRHLEPGDWDLELSAPSYEPVTVPITLKRGRNILPDPIEMTGFEIPALQRFIIFEDFQGEDVLLEIRPVGEDGRAVLNHPSMDLWIGALVSVQIKAGLPVTTPTEEGSERGEELFRDRIDWEWDPLPETTFRYSGRIPGARIRDHQAPIWVIDYLIIVPDPRRIGPEEVEEVVKDAWELGDADELAGFLEQYRDRLSYYITTSWNVEKGK